MPSMPQELFPVPGIRLGQRPALIKKPVETFGEHLTKFLGTGPGRRPEGVEGQLLSLAHRGDRLEPALTAQQEKPVVVVDVGKEAVAAANREHQSACADESILKPAAPAVRMAH